MCQKNNLQEVTNLDLLIELKNRGILGDSESTKIVLEKVKEEENSQFKVVLSFGYPEKKLECRECMKELDPENFSFYLSRVDKNGFFMRSNALCSDCSLKSNSERKKVFENYKIPPKPNKGSVCPNCNRKWSGNWHRHHEGDKFIEWLCGHCNMSFSDQRNSGTTKNGTK